MGKRGEALQAEVLDALRSADGPLSAYDILAELRSTTPKMAPTTVYRVLAALTEKSLIHRLESLNAYIPCQCEEAGHEAIISICDDCGSVEETVAPELLATMAEAIGSKGFSAKRHVVEVHGTCADCSPEDATQ
ncbi:MAG: Fur family transcriptional regulator [Pseudomonadota bacterium]